MPTTKPIGTPFITATGVPKVNLTLAIRLNIVVLVSVVVLTSAPNIVIAVVIVAANCCP